MLFLLCVGVMKQLQQNNKCEQMQNHAAYSSNLPNFPSPSLGSPKFNSQAYSKPFDKTLPISPLKHYSSNPNISLEINQHRTPHNLSNDPNPNSTPLLPKNHDFRTIVNQPNYGNGQGAGYNRANRNELSKSLILSDMEKHQIPEEVPPGKKELFKNMPRRAVRMSETIQDAPVYHPRREEYHFPTAKEINFQKVKDSEQRGERKEVIKQPPSFLSRVNSSDMKRSLVIDSHQHKISQFQLSKETAKAKQRKVSVEDFIKIKELGNGKYGRVYLVKQRHTNFICALKVIQKKLLHQQEITDQFTREVKIQMYLNHPNIIKMYGCFSDAVNIYIILEVGTGGQLYHQLKKAQPLSEARIAFVMKQVCQAVNQIHSLRIIHRDIKPQNIVLHDNIIKLCDFGWSVHQDNKLRTTFCGTPLYVCPEILKGREYDQKIDIWSIGIMMYEMVVGENPFKITREQQLIKIVKDEIKIPSYLFVSAEVRDFLDKCLQKNPDDRATIKQLMNHPFFKKHQQKGDKSSKLLQSPS